MQEHMQNDRRCKCNERYELILEKLAEIQSAVERAGSIKHNDANNDGNAVSNIAEDFIDGKKDEIKKDIAAFMLANFNIKQLDDSIEGDIYEFVAEKLLDLTIGRFF